MHATPNGLDFYTFQSRSKPIGITGCPGLCRRSQRRLPAPRRINCVCFLLYRANGFSGTSARYRGTFRATRDGPTTMKNDTFCKTQFTPVQSININSEIYIALKFARIPTELPLGIARNVGSYKKNI